ncbi:MAG: hypothetical protein ABR976_03265 [Terracidiphilus sp.]|jgi:hypothetical protein
MKFAGLLVMPAGFFLSIAAIVLFPAYSNASRVAFILCGLAVEALGLVVAFRGHMQSRGSLNAGGDSRS